MDLWGKVIEKVVNIEVKTSLQPLSKIREIDSEYSKGYKLTKKDKNKANWEYKYRDKAKSHNLSLANTNQSQIQTQVFKKNKCY